jgi:hypothetical protein
MATPYLTAEIDCTWMVFVFVSRRPTTRTFSPASFWRVLVAQVVDVLAVEQHEGAVPCDITQMRAHSASVGPMRIASWPSVAHTLSVMMPVYGSRLLRGDRRCRRQRRRRAADAGEEVFHGWSL